MKDTKKVFASQKRMVKAGLLKLHPGPASNLRLQITASCWAKPSEVPQKTTCLSENGSEKVSHVSANGR